MTITEQTRHTIYEAFRASFGDEVANGLMELLPPVGWADVATKHDLVALEERMDLRFEATDLRFEALEERMDLRFHALEERMDLRFESIEERMDRRFEASDARFGERLERALRRQSAAFTASLLSGLALFGVIDRLVG